MVLFKQLAVYMQIYLGPHVLLCSTCRADGRVWVICRVTDSVQSKTVIENCRIPFQLLRVQCNPFPVTSSSVLWFQSTLAYLTLALIDNRRYKYPDLPFSSSLLGVWVTGNISETTLHNLLKTSIWLGEQSIISPLSTAAKSQW